MTGRTTTTKQTARGRGQRCSLLSLCLGMGALTVALLARLLAHKPEPFKRNHHTNQRVGGPFKSAWT